MKINRKEEGVTLTVLAITIIIILILAGIIIRNSNRRKWFNRKNKASNRKLSKGK